VRLPSLALIFPGQGSQHRGMGQALALAFPEARAAFAEADEALGFPLSELCFAGSEEDLARTENTQPAILAASIAAWRVLEARGVHPAAVAGHSLGEYSALVAAGSLTLADAVRIVRERGRFMQEAVPLGVGAMAAVLGLAGGDLSRLCQEEARGEVVAAANLNGPDQVVIAGHAGAVARVVDRAKEAGARRAVPLPVSAPFHCALMEPAATRLRPVLAAAAFRDPAVPVYTNVDAAPVRTGEEAREALGRQVASTVRWQEEVEAMAAAGLTRFLEVGPGKVLAGLVRRIGKDLTVLSVGDPEGVAAVLREGVSA
jgi:[acyl-carrier-protein] S-malonyltransferase